MLVLATSVPMTDRGKEVVVKVPCIYYPVWFQKDQEQVRALLDSGNKLNAMNLAFAWKVGFHIRKTNVRAQKIDSSALEIFGMIIADF